VLNLVFKYFDMNKVVSVKFLPFLDEKKAHNFLFVFYAIAIIGFILPFTRNIFIALTKWALLLNVFVLFYFHSEKFSVKSILLFTSIAFSGYAIEVVGVQTGIIFGKYSYLHALGISFFDTPLLIGLNWLMLSYLFASVLRNIKFNKVLKSLLGAGGMLVYDMFLETICVQTEMWYWHSEAVPWNNYLAWFSIAFIFQIVIQITRVDMKNFVAKTMLIGQLAYVIVLSVFFTINI